MTPNSASALLQISQRDVQAIVLKHIDTWRALERARYQFHFLVADPVNVIDALAEYQNADGGFGNGLEADITMPFSSPMATTVALQILEDITPLSMNLSEEVVLQFYKTVKRALLYLAKTYKPERLGWVAADRRINDFPHAPWWHAGLGDSLDTTPIDGNWGNPSVEILGYFRQWQSIFDYSDTEWPTNWLQVLDQVEEKAIGHLRAIESSQGFESEHELFCYCRAYKHLNAKVQAALEPIIGTGVRFLVHTDPTDAQYSQYVPKPLDFVKLPSSPHFCITPEEIDIHLNYLIEQLMSKGQIEPSWSWGSYEKQWKLARVQWSGVLTLNALIHLKEFGRIL